MSDYWETSPQGHSPTPREFLVSAELYVSTAAGASLRKPPNPRKRSEKRESVKQTSSIVEDSKKIKEKSSWLTLARGPTGNGQWRPATCKLSEEGERCLLNIYVDESILYQTLYIHLLNHTDIRLADTSLFFRKFCLGIYCVAGQRWCSNNTGEPVYLQFPSADDCNTWLALLRSYAIPEIYGRLMSPTDGGSYRMWRQVEMSVVQGRNLGNTKPFEATNTGGTAESNSEPDPVDLDVSCEIHLNETLCGRTTVKKGIGSPDWHEAFTFTDLPPFENLDVMVWREKKLFKPTLMGIVRITLSNFRRGEMVDGWFPVLHTGSIASDIQVGDIRLRIRVDEEIVLPYSAYSGLLNTFTSRNFLDWMSDFETKLKLKTIATQLMSIAIANNKLIDHVQLLLEKEVDGTPSSHQTVFRGNTILTKVMELCMAWYGKVFLEASIGTVLRRLCGEKVSIEVDPARSGKGAKDVERNVDQLVYWCHEFWNQIYSVRMECPHEMRRLFEAVRKLVERRYQTSYLSQDNRELPWQSVSAFCFLRFIVPAILHPHLFGLCPGLPSAQVQRSLTLIAKVIQSLANLNANVQKEDFMRGVQDFLRDSRPAMIDYILVVSTPSKDGYAYTGSTADRHDRLNVVNSLRERARMQPVLVRESIPILPHLLDIPRHLAIITSAVIRHSRDHLAKQKSHTEEDRPLNEFCTRCYEVEEKALQRVSYLATRVSSGHRRPSASGSWTSRTPPISARSPASPLSSSFTADRPRQPRRPSTAPSATSDTDKSRRQLLSGDSSSPSSPLRTFARAREPDIRSPPPPQQKDNRRHFRSTSTDSISIPSYDAQGINSTSSKAESTEDSGKRKKGLFRGIWKR